MQNFRIPLSVAAILKFTSGYKDISVLRRAQTVSLQLHSFRNKYPNI